MVSKRATTATYPSGFKSIVAIAVVLVAAIATIVSKAIETIVPNRVVGYLAMGQANVALWMDATHLASRSARILEDDSNQAQVTLGSSNRYATDSSSNLWALVIAVDQARRATASTFWALSVNDTFFSFSKQDFIC